MTGTSSAASKKKGTNQAKKKTSGKKKRVSWPARRVNKLLDVLFQKRAAIGEGGHFKPSVYAEAAVELNKMDSEGGGVVFDGTSVKNFWTKMRAKQSAVAAIKRKSGWAYTLKGGAGITAATLPAWTTFIAECKAAIPFKSKGFEFYDRMCEIAPAKVSGKNVFNAGEGGDDGDESDSSSHSSSSNSTPATPVATQKVTGSSSQGQPINVSDSEGEDEGELPTLPTPPRRRKKADADTKVPAKKPRTSFQEQAMAHIAKSTQEMSRMTDLLETVFSKDAEGTSSLATPTRRNAALDRCQDLEVGWLTREQMVGLVKVFQSNTAAADTYMTLKLEDLRKDWVIDTLKALDLM